MTIDPKHVVLLLDAARPRAFKRLDYAPLQKLIDRFARGEDVTAEAEAFDRQREEVRAWNEAAAQNNVAVVKAIETWLRDRGATTRVGRGGKAAWFERLLREIRCSTVTPMEPTLYFQTFTVAGCTTKVSDLSRLGPLGSRSPETAVALLPFVKLKLDEIKREKQREAEQDHLRAEAILYLVGRGWKLVTENPGEMEFTGPAALETANTVAFDEEVARRTAADDIVSFSGDDSCEGCVGWSPKDHRCSCGNRRVEWARSYSHTFKEPSIYAEAY